MEPEDKFEKDYTAFALSPQHNGVTGSFSDLSKAFKDNPTLEHYLELRRGNPGKLIEVSPSSYLSWVLANEERLEALGISTNDVVGCLDADEASASRLSLRLIELLVERRGREGSGETHLVGRGEAISDSLVNYLIAMMLDALDSNDNTIIARDLIVLIKHRLGAGVSVEDRTMEVRRNRRNALYVGAYLKKCGKPVSLGSVAQVLKVERSTVLRWFKGSNFQNEVDGWFRTIEAFDTERGWKKAREVSGASD